MAFSLPHGSLLLEVAKHEVHATTALDKPNRILPTRDGMVFYRHSKLIFPHHAKEVYPIKQLERMNQRYEDWKRGAFVPIPSQLKSMKALGFKFPDNVKLKKSKNEKTDDSNRFNPKDFPDFTPGRETQGNFTTVTLATEKVFSIFILIRNNLLQGVPINMGI